MDKNKGRENRLNEMSASVYDSYGPPDVLQIKTLKRPTIQEDELLVRIHAATVNRTDCAMLLAKPFIMRFITGLFSPKKKILGTDFAGEIVSVGSAVSNYKIGDKIFGFDDLGVQSHAQFAKIKNNKPIGIIPQDFSYSEAVSCLEGAHYAINFINKINVKPQDSILVNGATGAIGSALVQLLKAQNARVTAVCKKDNFELVQALGANHCIDYVTEDFTTHPDQFDYVFDAVGKSSFPKCKSILKSGGTYISSEAGRNAQNIFYSLYTPILGRKKVVFPIPSSVQKSIYQITKLMELKQFRGVIDRTYPLSEVRNAFHYVLKGQKIGNVILQTS